MTAFNNPSGSTLPSRRAFLQALSAGVATVLFTPTRSAALSARASANAAQGKAITVYKDPGCGCCKSWVDHMKKAGFVVTIRDTTDMAPVKASMGVPAALASCHTAVIGKYVIEGHVPADLVNRLLTEKPAALGLAVPGMPSGSPGMETPGAKDPYKVLLFDRSGKTSVYASR
jgi:hypothetical protein